VSYLWFPLPWCLSVAVVVQRAQVVELADQVLHAHVAVAEAQHRVTHTEGKDGTPFSLATHNMKKKQESIFALVPTTSKVPDT
jgi:hypothetical protein